MPSLDIILSNLTSPVVLAFVLGIVAALVRSDLRLPTDIYAAISIYLLLAIGLKGGAELSVTAFADVVAPAAATLVIGILTPLSAYAVARRFGGFEVADAAALAAHYGSVSMVTFLACMTFLQTLGVPFEAYAPALVVLLEIPAIVVGLGIARAKLGSEGETGGSWAATLHEIFAGRGIVLLLGGLVIGWLAGKPGMAKVEGFFVAPFQGVLTLFLLEMGIVAARRLRDLRTTGLFLVAFGTVMPLAHGALGAFLGSLAGLSLGGTTVLAVLAASASYIAAPAAVRIALPQANPSYYLTASLGITFPFNLTIGIPYCYWMAQLVS
jgi:hypothetical protein